MNCMRCGKEIALGQAFCKECLTDMEQHPVKPDTPIQLPSQVPVAVPRRTPQVRKVRKPEEQLIRLRRQIRVQTIVLLVISMLFTLSSVYFIWKLHSQEQIFSPGQNYSTVEPTTTTP